MATREEKIAEMAKLLASGAITTEEFTRIIDALNGEVGHIEAQDEIVEDSPTPFELEYIRVMEYYMTQQISPATSHYPPLSSCTVDDDTRWNSVFNNAPCLELFKDELHVIHSYIDGQNSYGAVLRDNVDIVFDDRHRIILSLRDGDNDFDGKLNVTLQYPNAYLNEEEDDSIESELYEKYLRDKFGEDCSFTPFNKKMLCEADVPLLDVPENAGFFDTLAAKSVTGHVFFILTTATYSDSRCLHYAVIVLDSFSNFNLIRIFTARKVTISDGKVDVIGSNEGIYTTWKLSDSPSTAQDVKISAEQTVQDKMSGVNKAADVPIQTLLEQVDYNKMEESYNTCMQNLLTNNRKYKGCSYPPFNKSMLKVRDIMGLKDEKTCSYEIHTSMSKLFMKIDLTIYLKDLVSCEVLEVK